MSHEIDNDLSTDGLDLEALGLSEEFTPEKHLTGPEEIAAYLTEILEDDDFAQFNEALNVIARSEGAPKVAALAKISREGLYKALRKDSKPRFETVMGVLDGIGMQVVVQPKMKSGLGKVAHMAGTTYAVIDAALKEYSTVQGECVGTVVSSLIHHHPSTGVEVLFGERRPAFAGGGHVVEEPKTDFFDRRRPAKKRSYAGVTSEPEVIQPFTYQHA
jgi:probable addiction module antidote protein